jgi:uncharacterized protein (TIGR02246 family)
MPKIILKDLFAAIDSMDAEAFAAFFADDGVFRYGSQPLIQGRDAVRDYVAGFFSTIAGLSHRVDDTWERDDTVVMRGDVTYTRLDRKQVELPFTTVFYLEGDRIKQYLIYVDPSPLAG